MHENARGYMVRLRLANLRVICEGRISRRESQRKTMLSAMLSATYLPATQFVPLIVPFPFSTSTSIPNRRDNGPKLQGVLAGSYCAARKGCPEHARSIFLSFLFFQCGEYLRHRTLVRSREAREVT